MEHGDLEERRGGTVIGSELEAVLEGSCRGTETNRRDQPRSPLPGGTTTALVTAENRRVERSTAIPNSVPKSIGLPPTGCRRPGLSKVMGPGVSCNGVLRPSRRVEDARILGPQHGEFVMIMLNYFPIWVAMARIRMFSKPLPSTTFEPPFTRPVWVSFGHGR